MPLRIYLNLRRICAVSGMFLFQSLCAQYFTLGTDPPSVKWKEIKTDHFSIIYPEEYEGHSQHIANGLEHVYEPERRTLGYPKPAKTPFIVHTRSTRPRAFCPYAPHRIEFVTTPPQDFYTQNWIDDIIIHEFRHVSQYAALNKGFTKDLSYVIGEQAIPLVIGLYVPLWFLEGDATIMETTASRSGRGRVANFEMRLKAQVLEKGIYSYEKAVLGSYRDFTPSCYELGYQLVGHSRIRYGPEFCANTLDKVGKKAYSFTAFSNSLKKQTGMGKSELYQSVAGELAEKWKAEEEKTPLTPSNIILNVPENNYTCYGKPQAFNDSFIVAEKTSLDDIARIVIIDGAGQERTLLTPGKGFIKNSLSVNGSSMCWQENDPDPRWSLQDYMVINAYDVKSKKTHHLTRNTRLFSPDISPDGNKIAAVHVNGDNTYQLAILDAHSGEPLKTVSTDENLFLSHPSWAPDNISVAAVVTSRDGKGIASLNTASGTYTMELPYKFAEVDWPVFYRHFILFVGSYSGTDNVYALDRETKSLYQVTSVHYGVSCPSVFSGTDRLIYMNYCPDGFRIECCNLDTAAWKHVAAGELDYKWYSLAEDLSQQEQFVYDADSLPANYYDPARYAKGLHLFRIHSWSPVSFSMENKSMSPGVALMSQNLLGSSFTSFGWSYDLNERAHRFDFSYTYDGLFTSLSILSDFSQRKGENRTGTGEGVSKWNEFNITGLAGIPLNWDIHAWSLSVEPNLGLTFKKVLDGPGFDGQATNYTFIAPEYELLLSNTYEMSVRDINPRWGQQVQVIYSHTPFDESLSSISGINAQFYFPGFISHHSFKAYAGYQQKIVAPYSFRDAVTYPRGYSDLYLDEALSMSLEYAFPISYPDLRLGPVLYIKRVKSAIFIDWAFQPSPGLNHPFWSSGTDLTADFHPFGLAVPIEAGIRAAYVSDLKRVKPVFLIAFNLDSMY